MAWNPTVIDVEDVPTVGIDHPSVAAGSRALSTEASEILIQVGRAKAAWSRVEGCYETSHTDRVLAAADDLWWVANMARHVFVDSAWAMRLLARDLEPIEQERQRLLNAVSRFRKAALVDLAAMVPGSPLYLQNLDLWRRAFILRSRIDGAISACQQRLDAIDVDPPRDNPYAGLTSVMDAGYEWWDMEDVSLGELGWNLFGDSGSIRGSQVDQGSLGNCWFMSSLAALADKDPDTIRDMIRQRPDGNYVVRLFVNGAWQDIVVDESVLIGTDGRPQFAGDGTASKNDRALWPLLVEKAAIQALGGDYFDLNAGRGAEAMEMFTGNEAQHQYFEYGTPYDHLAIAEFSELSQQPDVFMTASARVGPASTHTIDALSNPTDGSDPQPITVEYYNSHVYQVKNIDAEGNVTLVNPHNSFESAGQGSAATNFDKDEFTITPEQFNQMFTGLSYGSTTQDLLR
mgnify:CR=1 FL=1